MAEIKFTFATSYDECANHLSQVDESYSGIFIKNDTLIQHIETSDCITMLINNIPTDLEIYNIFTDDSKKFIVVWCGQTIETVAELKENIPMIQYLVDKLAK